MRLTILLLTASILKASANGNAQQITFSGKDVPLEKVFQVIEQQTGFVVFYNYSAIKDAKVITITAKKQPLKEFLDICFARQTFTYLIQGRTILISQRQKYDLDSLQTNSIYTAQVDISGRVTDQFGNPLAGASVSVKGKKVGVVTDVNGIFILKGLFETDVITITYTGFKEFTSKIGTRISFIISLEVDDNPLNEVIVKPYWTEKRRLEVGNTGRITEKVIKDQPVENVLLAMQDRIPGLEVIQNSAMNGGGITVRIQGQNSLASGGDPLIIVDGVPYASQTLSSNSVGAQIVGTSGPAYTPAAGGAGNPLNYINVADIQSVDVLKDAEATSIYGSRAANGAIIITTKRGKPGKLQLDLNIQNGWGKVGKFLKVLNTPQYLEMRREAFKNDGLAVPSILTNPADGNYDVNGFWGDSKNTNWQKELIGGTAQYNNATLSLLGGSESTSFRLSGTYSRMTTVFPGEGVNRSGSLGFSLNNTSYGGRLRIDFSGSFMGNTNRIVGADLTAVSIQLAPNTPELQNQDGTLNWATTTSGASSFSNPMSFLEVKYVSKATNLVSSLGINYKLSKGLALQTNLGYTYQQINEFQGIPLSSYAPEYRVSPDPSSLRTATYSNNNVNSWNLEPQLTYEHSFRKHKLNFLMGGTINQRFSTGLYYGGSGYISDITLENVKAAATVVYGNNVAAVYKYAGVFGRIGYNYSDKVLINLSVRRDGSSRFAPLNQFHNFGSIGAAWIFSEEKFIKEKLSILSFGKLRLTYGTTGNDQIGDYVYLPLLNIYSVTQPYQNSVGYVLGGLNNPHLEWEETKKIQAGLDFGFLNDRIFFTVNYARNRSSNQLLRYNLPLIAGSSSVNYNFPALLQNKSIEFSLQSLNLRTKSLEWTTGFNLTLQENKLVAFPDLETSTYRTTLVVGMPFNVLRAYQVLGVDPLNGNFVFLGQLGPTSATNESKRDALLLNPQAKYYAGLQNSVRFKNFQLNVSVQFKKGLAQNYLSNGVAGRFNTGYGNQPISVLDRWRQPGDISRYQRFSQNTTLNSSLGQANLSSLTYTDISFARLKNIALSWKLPNAWQNAAKLKSATLFINAQNLITITSFKGLDPETGATSLPPLRLITVGVQATF